MPHFAAVCSTTDEVMWTENPHALGPGWSCHKLSRAPTEFDEFDRVNKRLKANPKRKDQAARSSKSPIERIEELEAQVARLMEQVNGQ